MFISSTYYFQEVPGLREDTYELCYNAACLSLGQNDVETAQQKLKKAEGICWFSFFDTWSLVSTWSLWWQRSLSECLETQGQLSTWYLIAKIPEWMLRNYGNWSSHPVGKTSVYAFTIIIVSDYWELVFMWSFVSSDGHMLEGRGRVSGLPSPV